jgi:preprotein translocase subunit SecE
MSSGRLVALFWIGATFCIAIFFEKVIGDLILGALHAGDPTLFFDWRLSTILGFGLAIAIGIGTYLNPRLNQLAYEVANELKKVTWPTRVETQRQTAAVLLFTVIFAGILGLFDAVSSKVMTGWLPWLFGKIATLGR